MPEPLFTDREALSAVCQRHHIRRLLLFGSVLNGSNREDSDVDLLVEFEPDAKPPCSRQPRSSWSCRPCCADEK